MAVTLDKHRGLLSIHASVSEMAFLEESLRDIPRGAQKALTATVNDVTRYLGGPRGQINRAMRENLNLKASEIARHVKINKLASLDSPHSTIWISYHAVPLEDFKAKFSKAMGVTVTTVKADGPQIFRHMFRATMASGHTGIFQREYMVPKTLPLSGKYAGRMLTRGPRKGQQISRQRVVEAFGPAVMKSFELAPELEDKILYDASLKFTERMRSKIDWLLAGQRGSEPAITLEGAA